MVENIFLFVEIRPRTDLALPDGVFICLDGRVRAPVMSPA
jgi:hypothetical protein